MPIDPIYQAIKPVQIDPMGATENAMKLSQLGLQMDTQRAMRDAYSKNVGQDGQLDQQGYVSDISRVNPMAGMSVQKSMAEANKLASDAQVAKMQAAHQMLSITQPALEYLNQIPDETQRAQAFPAVLKQLAQQGIPMHNVPHDSNGNAIYDPGLFRQMYAIGHQTKEALDNQLTQSEIGKNNAEGMKTGAEELGKLNEDVNNPSSRKISGGLTDIINRSDRIIALSNAGAKPNETPTERAARLNRIMPQIAKEYNMSLATIMQGGVPTEGLQKELGTDTVDSALASLKQKFSGSPSGANQAEMIQQFVDTAQHLGRFARGRLAEIGDKSKAAYPYATKFFPNEVSKITSPLSSLQQSGMDSGEGAVLAQNKPASSSGIVNSTATAGSVPTTPDEDQAAIKWAQGVLKNPKAKATDIQKAHSFLNYHGVGH